MINKLIEMKNRISHYRRQRIKHYIIHVFMLAFLVLTLFPIVWMVYSSFKENTDILAGKVPISRAKNDVIAFKVLDDYVYAGTADGGINKVSKKTQNVEKYISFGTMSTNYLFEDKYIWISSANKGLERVDLNTLENKKAFPIPAFKKLEVNKIADTFMLDDGENLLYSLRYKGFEKVFSLNKSSGQVLKEYDLTSPLSPVQVLSFFKAKNILWVGLDKGLLKIRIPEGKIEGVYNFQGSLPSGVLQIADIKGQLMLASSAGVFIFNPISEKLINPYNDTNCLSSNQVEVLAAYQNKLYIGTTSGLSLVDLNSKDYSKCDFIFNAVGEGDKERKGDYTSSIVSAIGFDQARVYVGSNLGRVSVLSLNNQKVLQTLKLKEGHLVIAWRNYIDMFRNINFGLYLKNSFIICGFATFFAMIMATFAAYAISRYDFPGSKLFSLLILATQMIPGIMFLIPIYIMFVKVHEATGIPIKGTFGGMIFIYSAFFVPFSIWILRGFFAAIPKELEEAARIDGCSPLQVFWHVVLPLAIPGIIATGIYIFLTAWDELMFAWILTSADTMTIPVGIRLFVGNYQNRFDLMMAAATVATIPVMVLFFMLQKHIVKGLTAGAVKG